MADNDFANTAPSEQRAFDRARDVAYKTLAARMRANYASPGLRGESTYDAAKALGISNAVPRGQ